MDVSERKMSRMACEKCIQRWWGLADVARHVIQHTLNPRILDSMAPYDVTWRMLPATSTNAL